MSEISLAAAIVFCMIFLAAGILCAMSPFWYVNVCGIVAAFGFAVASSIIKDKW